MPFEHSAGAVIFRRAGDSVFYLLLNYPGSGSYWDLVKGHLEKGETELETLTREAREETGLTDLCIIDGFKEWIKYFFRSGGELISKLVTFYLAETRTEDIKISFEHIGYAWLPYEEAVKRLTYKNAQEILQKANEFIAGELAAKPESGGEL